MIPGKRFRAALGGLLAVCVVTAGATAQPADGTGAGRSTAREGHSGIYGWGPHIGVAGDPDQLVLGIHLDVGRIAPRVRFQPDLELGVGDNHTIFALTLPAHYMFRTSSGMTPYAGGGVAIGLDNRDRAGTDDDTDVEIAIPFTGGLEWSTAHGDRFFLELNLLAGDLNDIQAVGGITF